MFLMHYFYKFVLLFHLFERHIEREKETELIFASLFIKSLLQLMPGTWNLIQVSL